MTDRFPLITLSGSAADRGAKHGAELSESIASTIAFYSGALRIPEEEVLTTGRFFRDQIQLFYPPYCDEIEALADAAHQPPEWIYLLNARSELISHPLECSTIIFRDSCLLGQNWDYARPLHDLVTLLQVNLDNDRSFLTVTEPGIIGKIGMNSEGIGVCLNMLRLRRRCEGVPIHILLRAILESTSIDHARELASSISGSRVGCVTVANNKNECFAIEYAGENRWFLTPPGRICLHTNHYLGKRLTPEGGVNTSSYERLRTLARLTMILHQQDTNTMQRLLSDRSNSTWPVHMSWCPSPYPGFSEAGTIATIIMELENRVMHIRKGNSPDTPFLSYSVAQSNETLV
ncbi:C45 family peptidase [Sansalvadorimonas sp. 2012CJ34-2]|uniref:C45 family peptidase n=1 Tax=Parendozoicomonas callyspongiae TaxID=2942213 RepID=A0ABT0PDM6_9GAMM|nr:C45 family peptidase [Sansalvadorimonas sp. 2012CJ34-2]MCL6269408.1 C45 family peptidase [Sansalvadorimonas sp. 2012CJ34-2]